MQGILKAFLIIFLFYTYIVAEKLLDFNCIDMKYTVYFRFNLIIIE